MGAKVGKKLFRQDSRGFRIFAETTDNLIYDHEHRTSDTIPNQIYPRCRHPRYAHLPTRRLVPLLARLAADRHFVRPNVRRRASHDGQKP